MKSINSLTVWNVISFIYVSNKSVQSALILTNEAKDSINGINLSKHYEERERERERERSSSLLHARTSSPSSE